jgi:hypothetical protein
LTLPNTVPSPILPGMFVVTEADAAAIRAINEQDGELSAAIELRRRFPRDRRQRECAGLRPVHRRLDAVAGARAEGDAAIRQTATSGMT